jgi:hypothetical protein
MTIKDGLMGDVTTFGFPNLFPHFALPSRLPAVGLVCKGALPRGAKSSCHLLNNGLDPPLSGRLALGSVEPTKKLPLS